MADSSAVVSNSGLNREKTGIKAFSNRAEVRPLKSSQSCCRLSFLHCSNVSSLVRDLKVEFIISVLCSCGLGCAAGHSAIRFVAWASRLELAH